MSLTIVDYVQKTQIKSDLPELNIGDTVDVHVKIVEGDKHRIQIFNGVVIAFHGHGLTRMFTVRRIVANEGVERTFPLHSPRVSKIEVIRQGHVRRAKLFYLRDRVGKSRRLRDAKRGLEAAAAPEAPVETVAAVAAPAGEKK